jgi:hypothetical protein
MNPLEDIQYDETNEKDNNSCPGDKCTVIVWFIQNNILRCEIIENRTVIEIAIMNQRLRAMGGAWQWAKSPKQVLQSQALLQAHESKTKESCGRMQL